jgi:hypothetical protein
MLATGLSHVAAAAGAVVSLAASSLPPQAVTTNERLTRTAPARSRFDFFIWFSPLEKVVADATVTG